MGKDCGTWVPQLHCDWQSPNLSSIGAPLDAGKPNGVSAFMNQGIDNNMVARNETMPSYASSAQPHLQLGHSNEPHGWFYCLPRFRQAFMPAPNFAVHEKLPVGHVKGLREEIAPNGESQKQFLVIDQTGDQTTFIYSSGGLGNPIDQCLASWHQSKLYGPNNLNESEPSIRREVNYFIGPTFTAKVEENQGTDMESEMHEDTEEIDALLYSDSDEYSAEDDDEVDDEVTSTGHSPSTMTTHDDSQEICRGSTEEVGNFTGKSKKRKLSDCPFDDTATSLNLNLNLNRPNDNGDGIDAESRCCGGNSQGSGESGSLSGCKKMRKEKIRDILNILQSIIPGGQDKDPIMLIDEAIRCLKSLKSKARALGLDASSKLENS